MARKPGKKTAGGDFVLFDVFYEDGSRSSNRKVPAADLEGPEGDEAARQILEEQDRKVAEMAGRPKPAITSVKRSGAK